MSSGEFSFDTIQNFDRHIRNSIPNYDLLFEAVVSLSQFFSNQEAPILDIGCSTGEMLLAMPHKGVKVGLDLSTNLLPQSHERRIHFLNEDVRSFDFKAYDPFCFITSIFTMQFIPKVDRQHLLNRIYDSLQVGGAFVWAEKVVCDSGADQDLMTFAHYDFKRKAFSANEILAKEEDLRSLMHCNTSHENCRMAHLAGFDGSVLVWKFFNFECRLFRK